MDPQQLASLTPAEIALLPGLQPPPGVIPNFVNPPTLVPLGIAVLVLCLTVTTILVVTRVYLRTFLVKAWGWDDGMLIRSCNSVPMAHYAD